jgi:hypothetical protein
MAWAAIQTSLIGKGVPADFNALFSIPKISAVSLLASKMLTVGFEMNFFKIAMFSISRFPNDTG